MRHVPRPAFLPVGPARQRALAGRLLLAGAAAGVLLTQAHASPGQDASRTFLAATFGLTAGDVDRVHGNHVVTRTLPATDSREVATLGLVRIRGTPEQYVERLEDIAAFKKDDAVLQIGVFGTPAAMENVAALTFDDSDIRSLRGCRPGDCAVQLSAGAIGRVQREIDWRRADAGEQAQRLMRQVLVDYVAEYQRAGSTAGMVYADDDRPIEVHGELVSLVGSEVGGWHRFPALRRHLIDYPRSSPDIRDRVYWSKEQVGRKQVATVTHLAISRCTDEWPAEFAIASRQIYAAHYFDASLGLTVLVRDRAAAEPATYVVYVNRSRVDVFRGVFGRLARKIVTAKAKATVAEHLSRLQRRLDENAGGRP